VKHILILRDKARYIRRPKTGAYIYLKRYQFAFKERIYY